MQHYSCPAGCCKRVGSARIRKYRSANCDGSSQFALQYFQTSFSCCPKEINMSSGYSESELSKIIKHKTLSC